MGEAIMDARQSGVPITQAMQASQDDEIIEDITREAYKIPRYSTKKGKEKAVTEFGNYSYLYCMDLFDEVERSIEEAFN